MVSHVQSVPLKSAGLVIDGVAVEIGCGAIISDLCDDRFSATTVSKTYPTFGYAEVVEVVVTASDQIPEVRRESVAHIEFIHCGAID